MTAEAKLTIRLDKELHEKLKEKAKELRLTQSAIIRLALLQFLEGSRVLSEQMGFKLNHIENKPMIFRGFI